MQGTQATVRVLIVGAGPVGLTLANDLAARGVSFRIIDKLGEPTRNSRAHGLQSRTLEALDRLNLAAPIMAGAQRPQPPFVIYSGKKIITRVDFAGFLHEPYPFTLVIWQQRIERILEAALKQPGHTVERATRLVDFQMHGDGIAARIQRAGGTMESIHADWIVGCDGGHSTVREALGLKMDGVTLPGRFWFGEFDIDWRKSRDTMYEWWHRDGMAAAIYIDFTGKWHASVQSGKIGDSEPTLAQFQELFRAHTGEQNVTLANPAWIATLSINQRMPNRFIVGRAILAGDAAHVHSGAGGQGMNTGIQDALNLGWKLALTISGADAPDLLQSYESERLSNARHLLDSTRKYHRIQLPHGPVSRLAAATFFRSIQAIRPLGYAVAHKIGMLDVNYQHSVLSRHDRSHGARRARAGWHVPDAACRLDGEATRLFDILRGTQANVLLFAGAEPDPGTLKLFASIAERLRALAAELRIFYLFASERDAADACLSGVNAITDGGGHLQIALGLRGPELIYVRPDGYIGLRTRTIDCDTLFDYLGLIYRRRDETTAAATIERERLTAVS
jgi:2-polyprenyl-6-methoxyphenol hydroxylase-like FAD-dependent oxidoreductase